MIYGVLKKKFCSLIFLKHLQIILAYQKQDNALATEVMPSQVLGEMRDFHVGPHIRDYTVKVMSALIAFTVQF